MSKVFLSYPVQDRKLVGRLEPMLREKGLLDPDDVIINLKQDLEPGTDVRQAIRRQMQEAGKVIILDTPSSARSSWVNYEAGMASALDKPIVVVHAKHGQKSQFVERLGDVPSIAVEGSFDEDDSMA
jgi:MTH538 TIR-like domain (DUF1863).